jgi:hypothetical protein
MESTSATETTRAAKIDLKREIERSEWKYDPIVVFDQKASLAIAQGILYIFAGVYALGFGAMLLLFSRADASFEKGSDLVKFMIQSFLPLATLAVGYYLGERNRHLPATRGRK